MKTHHYLNSLCILGMLKAIHSMQNPVFSCSSFDNFRYTSDSDVNIYKVIDWVKTNNFHRLLLCETSASMICFDVQ